MVGFTSYGMVLASKSETGKVELVSPPPGAEVGSRVVIEPMIRGGGDNPAVVEPWSASRVKKYKVWETVAKDLRTNEDCVACWKGFPLMVSAEYCTVPSNINSPIS